MNKSKFPFLFLKKTKIRLDKLYRKFSIHYPIDCLIVAEKFSETAFEAVASLLRGKTESTPSVQTSSSGSGPAEKTMLLIRHDAIGDYILFRNFIEVLKGSSKYKDYKITLLGNAAWKELSEFLDAKFIGEFIWLDKEKFNSNFLYRYKKIKEITCKSYDAVIHPFSRDYLNIDNDIVLFLNAVEKIGSIRKLKKLKGLKWFSNEFVYKKLYTETIPDRKGSDFEFYKNKYFFETLLSEKIDIEKPQIILPEEKRVGFSKSPYAIIFIGASVKHRKWPVENFAQIALYLQEKYGMAIVLCGGKKELEDAAVFKKYLPPNFNYFDLTAKVNLIELLYAVKNSALVISNETMMPHIAMAASDTTQILVISSGENCYGFFTPYPKSISKGRYHIIYHPAIESNLETFIKNAALMEYDCGYDIKLNLSEITVESVKNKIDEVLKPN